MDLIPVHVDASHYRHREVTNPPHSQYICISIIGHKPTPTTTKPGNGITTPTPIQTGMMTRGKTFHFFQTDENCKAIVAKYKITLADFGKWNPAVGGTSCTGLWANTYACVGVL
jgi:hypothetical protein